MDKWIALDLIRWLALCLCLLQKQVSVVSMLLCDHLVQTLNNSFAQLVRAESDAEFISRNLETSLQMRQNVVVNLVHAQV